VNETVITVAEAAEDLRKIVERARTESLSFLMMENGISVARIVPENEKVCSGRDLAQALAQIKNFPTDFEEWRAQSRRSHNED
jgi:hypothetical protein